METWICVAAGMLQVFGQVRGPCRVLIRPRVVSAFVVPARWMATGCQRGNSGVTAPELTTHDPGPALALTRVALSTIR